MRIRYEEEQKKVCLFVLRLSLLFGRRTITRRSAMAQRTDPGFDSIKSYMVLTDNHHRRFVCLCPCINHSNQDSQRCVNQWLPKTDVDILNPIIRQKSSYKNVSVYSSPYKCLDHCCCLSVDASHFPISLVRKRGWICSMKTSWVHWTYLFALTTKSRVWNPH